MPAPARAARRTGIAPHCTVEGRGVHQRRDRADDRLCGAYGRTQAQPYSPALAGGVRGAGRMTPDTEYERLTPTQVARIDAACDRFEQAWKKAEPAATLPDLAEHLDGFDEAERTLLIRELIALDRAYRVRRGVPAAEYHTLGAGESPTLITREPGDSEIPPSTHNIPGCEI